MTDEPATPPAPAAAATATVEPEFARVTWYWCTRCHLVQSRPGACSGCKQPLALAPEWGIPFGPYRPPPKDESRRSRWVIPIVVGGIAIVLVGIATLLYVGGEDVDAGRRGGAARGFSTFISPSLGGTIDLPGTWLTDITVAEKSRQIALSFADAGPIRTDVAARKGNAFVVIVAGPTTDPASVIQETRTEQPERETDADGATVATSASRDVRIGGFEGVFQEFEGRDRGGRLTFKGRQYLVNTKDSVVIIVAVAPPKQVDTDFVAVTQALLSLG